MSRFGQTPSSRWTQRPTRAQSPSEYQDRGVSRLSATRNNIARGTLPCSRTPLQNARCGTADRQGRRTSRDDARIGKRTSRYAPPPPSPGTPAQACASQLNLADESQRPPGQRPRPNASPLLPGTALPAPNRATQVCPTCASPRKPARASRPPRPQIQMQNELHVFARDLGRWTSPPRSQGA